MFPTQKVDQPEMPLPRSRFASCVFLRKVKDCVSNGWVKDASSLASYLGRVALCVHENAGSSLETSQVRQNCV